MTTTTTTTTTTAAQPTAARPMPVWLSIPIILASLAAGTWIIHWYVGSRARADEPHVLGDAPATPPGRPEAAGGARPRPRPNLRNIGGGGRPPLVQIPGFGGGGGNSLKGTVRMTSGSDPSRPQFDAIGNKARVKWTVLPGRPPLVNAVEYGPGKTAYAFLPAATSQTIIAARQMANNPDAVAAAKLSADQVGRLRGLADPSFGMAVSEADRQLLATDLAGGNPARDAAAKAKLLADVDAIADRSQAATEAAATARAGQINAIVTAEQWAAYRAYGGGHP